ncbi:MAG: hypothetical protein P1V51_01360 [Deltaproteobacteria bacterium]|nr:hypothetical protein [Deltaproteobacteria bacterium]
MRSPTRGSLLLALLLASACGTLPGRGRVAPLGRHAGIRNVRATGEGPVAGPIAAAAGPALAEAAGLTSEAGEPAFRLEIRILEARSVLTGSRSDTVDLVGRMVDHSRSGRLIVEGLLALPDGTLVGRSRWGAPGAPPGQEAALHERAGRELGRQLGLRVGHARTRFVARDTGDERILLSPSELTLRPGHLLVSNDELLLFRMAMGLSDRVQLQLWLGGFPVPGAIGGAVPAGGLIAGGAGGLAIFGFFDLGLKVKILDEQAKLPGVALAYDLLDLFGAGIGGGGVAFLGNGVAGAGFVAVGGANMQFNLFTLTVGKHFGPRRRTHLVAGAYLLDNHHLLPQSFSFRSACGAGGLGAPGVGGGVDVCAGDDRVIERIPVQLLPFFAAEQRVGQRWSFATELLPRAPFRDTMLTTGLRLQIGPGSGKGLMGPEAFRLRLGFALLWVWAQDADTGEGGKILPLPWLSLGVHLQSGS